VDGLIPVWGFLIAAAHPVLIRFDLNAATYPKQRVYALFSLGFALSGLFVNRRPVAMSAALLSEAEVS